VHDGSAIVRHDTGHYGIPEPIRTKALTCLDHTQLSILKSFESRNGT
jgi:hypothetical protein